MAIANVLRGGVRERANTNTDINHLRHTKESNSVLCFAVKKKLTRLQQTISESEWASFNTVSLSSALGSIRELD